MSTLLEINEDIFKNQLIITDQQGELEDIVLPSKSNVTAAVIKPEPGLCVKTKDSSTNAKMFINVCTSVTVPEPEDISTDELMAIFESENPSDFRVPMSIGAPHEECDKGGTPCQAYDVVINPSFLDKINNNPLFSTFFMVVTIEGLEQKYGLNLDKNSWTILKNRKYLGQMPTEQKVRTSLPLIQELSGIKEWKPNDFTSNKSDISQTQNKDSKDSPLISEISTSRKTNSGKKEDRDCAKKAPSISIEKKMAAPQFCETPFLWIEVELSGLVSATEMKVEVGEDRLVVESEGYFLDEVFPYNFDTSLVKTFFIKPQRILVVVLPLKKEKS